MKLVLAKSRWGGGVTLQIYVISGFQSSVIKPKPSQLLLKFQTIVNQNQHQSNYLSVITFDTQLKTALTLKSLFFSQQTMVIP